MPLIMAEYHTFQWRLLLRSVSDVCDAVSVVNTYRSNMSSVTVLLYSRVLQNFGVDY